MERCDEEKPEAESVVGLDIKATAENFMVEMPNLAPTEAGPSSSRQAQEGGYSIRVCARFRPTRPIDEQRLVDLKDEDNRVVVPLHQRLKMIKATRGPTPTPTPTANRQFQPQPQREVSIPLRRVVS